MAGKGLKPLNPFDLLNGISIKNRLVVLGIVTVFGFSIFGILYEYFSLRTATAFRQNSNYALTARSVLDARIEVLKLRAIENRFLAQKKPEIAARFIEKEKHLRKQIARIVSGVDNSSIRDRLISTGRLLDIYRIDFEKVVGHQKALGFDVAFVANSVTGKNSTPSLTVLFSNAATAMEKRLMEEMEFGDAATMLPLITGFYRSRQMAGDYIASGKKDSLRQFFDESKRLLAAISESQLDEDTQNSISRSLQKYTAQFRAWVKEYEALATSRVQLGELSDMIRNKFAQIVKMAQQGHARTGAMLEKTRSMMSWSLLVAGFVMLGVVSLLNYIISRSISTPLGQMTKLMQRLSEGDTSISIETGQRHEIGAMQAAIGIFRDNAIERERLEKTAAEKYRKEHRQKEYIEHVIHDFARETNRIMTVLDTVTDKMKQTSATLTSVASQTTSEAGAASEASGSAAQNVQTVASATEQLSGSIREIARQSQHVSEIISRSSENVEHIDARVNDLSSSAQKIGDVISIISEIAEQTNLLALNATIEAARAGEAGKGFAVVAQEVKALASQTAAATDEITTQIGSVQKSALATASDIGSITGTMEEIRNLTSGIASAVDQQDAATREISRSIATAADHTNRMTGSMSAVTGSISETSREATEVLNVVGELVDVQRDLSAAMSSFTRNIVADVA